MLDSLISYVLLTLGLATTLFLFLSAKRDMLAHAVRERKRVDALVDAMAERLREVWTPPPEPVYLPALRSGLNIGTRMQALRMLRRGEDRERTAAALGVPRCEIELLSRVEAIAAKAKTAAD
jgi:hypothetical protein